MGQSSKSHKSKDDKETQSQHLKIFNELDRLKMHREMMNTDPEKANLLKERKDERKKKKHHSLSRLKSDQKTNLGSSGYEWNTRSEAYKVSVEPNDKETGKFMNEPFGADSFVYRGNIGDDDKGSTSKMSCVLEKLRRSEYMGLFCLCIIFALSILAVCLIVFKSIPVLDTEGPVLVSKGTFGDNYRRTMEVLKKKRHHYGVDHKRDTDNIDTNSRRMQGLNQLSGMDSDDGLSESDIEESNKYLSSKLNIKNINEINNERLKLFFKKLSETDARIRCLKKKIEQEQKGYTTNERYKRSVNNRRRQSKRVDDENKKASEYDDVDSNDDDYLKGENDKPKLGLKIKGKLKNKRSANDSDALTSVVIQHKKVEVQYKRNNGKFRKCSHLPTDSNSHENVMKHPFYKNTQRFDDILDRLINKDFPDVLDEDFQTLVKTKGGCKHENASQEVDNVSEINKDQTEPDNRYDIQQTASAKYGDIVVDGTTMPNETPPKISYNYLLNEVPKIRKLMQIDEATNENEDDDEAEDEDEEFDEIAKDSVDLQGGEINRKQREAPKFEDSLPSKHTISPNILNPNWKGPTPLYSDEVNAMMSTVPDNSPSHEPKALSADKESKETGDVEYVEEYLSSNNHRLAEMAQAYSDYGVLSESKETKIDRMPGDKRNSKEVDVESKNIVKRKDDSGEEENNIVVDVFKTIATHSKNWVPQPPVLVSDELIQNNSIQNWNDLQTLMKSKEVILPITVSSRKVQRSLKSSEGDPNAALNNQTTEFEDPSAVELYNSFLNKKNIGRSLKSIEESDVDSNKDAEVNDAKIVKSESNDTTSKFGEKTDSIINGSSIETVISSVLNETRDNKEIGPSHFMAMMSEWFWLLSNLFSETSNNSTVPQNVSKSNNTIIPFPVYDSDMVDNIAHRSRVLLSVTENNDNQTEIAKENEIKAFGFNNEIQRNTKNVTENTKSESNATDSKDNKIVNYNDLKDKSNNTKTIVKRSALNDNNLVFWNDLYDEEYGLQERVDNPNRGGGSFKGKHEYKDSAQNLLTNSGRWLGDQYKRLADNLKYRLNPDKSKKREYRSVFGYPKPYRRLLKEAASSKNAEEKETVTPKPKHQSFAELSANMKHICLDAAKAVADTRKNAVKKETKEGAMTNTMMQQLVRLMTDVVDMQVHEKTCLKLPPDLANFLEWLTQPEPDSVPKKGNLLGNMLQTNTKMNDFEYLATEPNNEFDIITTPPVKYQENPAADYLSIFQAVQELQQQYEEMDDEEKNKMSEARNYLQSQEEYLNSILQSGVLLKKSIRKKKETKREKRKITFTPNDLIDSLKLRARRKFIKGYVRKHTQGTTVGNLDDANMYTEELFKKDNSVLEDKERSKQKTVETNAGAKRTERFAENSNDKVRQGKVDNNEKDQQIVDNYGKRNIYDVYYKAVEDSKKMTTPKISAKIRVTDEKFSG